MRYIRTYPQSGLHVGERRGDRLLLGAHCRASDRVRAIGFRADMTFHLVRRCVDDPFDCEVHEEVLRPVEVGATSTLGKNNRIGHLAIGGWGPAFASDFGIGTRVPSTGCRRPRVSSGSTATCGMP